MTTSGAVSQAVPVPRWSSTIDRGLVHRNAVAEVLLTDVVPVTSRDFVVGAQWPRSHRVYRPDAQGRHDPMLLLETVRQVGLALSHSGFGVPLDQRSVMRDLDFRLDPAREPLARRRATDVTIEVHCENVTMRGGARPELKGMTVVLALSAQGRRFATGTGTIRWLAPDSYERFRARAGLRPDWISRFADDRRPQLAAAPVSGEPTDFRDSIDSLIAAESAAPPAVELPASRTAVRRLLVPLQHPVYFDHPLDHVPGMVLIDAAWQAVLAMRPRSGARLIGCRMDCPAFTELDDPVDIEVELPAVGHTARFAVNQRGRATATGSLELSS